MTSIFDSDSDSAPLSKRARRGRGAPSQAFELVRVVRAVPSTETLPNEIVLPHCAFVVGSAVEGAYAVCLEHPSLSRFVSRTHAEFGPAGDGHYVADRGSTNGTWLNGERLPAHEKRALLNGDNLTFGEPNVLLQLAHTPNCYTYVYQRRTVHAGSDDKNICALCAADCVDPHTIVPCGHTFCRGCIGERLTSAQRNACPSCSEELIVPIAIPCHVVRQQSEPFERRGKHEFGRPVSSFVARKLRDKGIFNMRTSQMGLL